jgi:transcription initiation factor TFIIIB Brf1 subunit/transcription initiation factor TFIIB
MSELRIVEIEEECEVCGSCAIVVFTTAKQPANGWAAYDGDETRCQSCGDPGMISCDAETPAYVVGTNSGDEQADRYHLALQLLRKTRIELERWQTLFREHTQRHMRKGFDEHLRAEKAEAEAKRLRELRDSDRAVVCDACSRRHESMDRARYLISLHRAETEAHDAHE